MKKYVLVGAGARALYMFAKPIVNDWKDQINFAGVYDVNSKRAHFLSEECGGIPVFEDFYQMLNQVKPDKVIVASKDSVHHTHIIASLKAGSDVISEKPMTIDEEKTREILEAERETGKKVLVTFNLRFAPYFAEIKRKLKDDLIGKVHHIDLEWFLDRNHGTEYFRRWHSEMENSGGLLVHKSSHHFDIVNWWIESTPKSVQAFGTRRVFGDASNFRGIRCKTCDFSDTCEYYTDISKDKFLKKYYLDAEEDDGYMRDRCVFNKDIDIYDHMSVNVLYEDDTLLTYSLVANSPYEGWRATINGSKGRMEIQNIFRNADMEQESTSEIKIYYPDEPMQTFEVDTSAPGHGGGDERLRQMLFGEQLSDPLGQQADSYAGAMALLIGAVANQSIKDQEVKQIPILK